MVDRLLKSLLRCKEEGRASAEDVSWVFMMLIVRCVTRSVQVSFVSARGYADLVKILVTVICLCCCLISKEDGKIDFTTVI